METKTKRKMKRLAFSLFFIAAAASAPAQEVELVFEVNDPEARTATLSDGKSLRNATELIIPETTTIDGVEYTVTCIDFEGAPFGSKNTSKITHVLVPKTVTEIKHLSRIGSQRTPCSLSLPKAQPCASSAPMPSKATAWKA